MCPVDKAANNTAFICKKYYHDIILKELGLILNSSPTYEVVDQSLTNILRQEKITLQKDFKIKCEDEE